MREAFEVPEPIVAHARRFAAGDNEPVPPRRASTVVLLRPGQVSFDVFVIRRVATMAFAAGMYAFPGGVVDPRDADVTPAWAGPAPADWAVHLRLDEATARAVVCAAVREVFEESGVLLAGSDSTTVLGDVSGDDWEADRVALIERTIGFAEMLARRELVLRSDLLVPWARWITPEFEPRRYDTYFFLARLPELQRTRDVGGEAAVTRWAPPAELAGDENPMLPPTRLTLRQLSMFTDVEAALAAAAGRDPVAPLMPRLELEPDGVARLIVTL
jgi:8-oxo-dGTP pyrophosphatase MutT (NUDIX family)